LSETSPLWAGCSGWWSRVKRIGKYQLQPEFLGYGKDLHFHVRDLAHGYLNAVGVRHHAIDVQIREAILVQSAQLNTGV
jgi:hypothetical protein